MVREFTPTKQDQIAVLSDASWLYLTENGAFFEADIGDALLELEQTDEHLMIILSGQATLIYYEDGVPQPTAIYRVAGEVLHHAGMHLQTPNPFRIESAGDKTRVVLIDRAAVYDLISTDRAFAEFLFKDLSQRFMQALSYLREERVEPLLIRLAKRILTITRYRPSVEFTQAELADILAVTRISISKAIKTLEEQGLIKRAERSLILVDRDKLKVWLSEQDRDH